MSEGPVALITAVPFEAAPLLGQKAAKSKGLMPATEGVLGGSKIVHMTSGVGIANAAHAATVLIERFSPRLVILFGIGGAYPSSGLSVGDVAAAEKEIYADAGVLLRDGPHGMDAIGLALLKKGGRKYFNDFPLNRRLLGLARRLLGAESGTFLTVCQSTGTRRRALELKRRFGAICENMEGAAVAHVCAIYGLPALEIRGISNIVEDRDPRRWEKELAADNCAGAVRRLFESGALD